jgi:hypothetical protein
MSLLFSIVFYIVKANNRTLATVTKWSGLEPVLLTPHSSVAATSILSTRMSSNSEQNIPTKQQHKKNSVNYYCPS